MVSERESSKVFKGFLYSPGLTEVSALLLWWKKPLELRLDSMHMIWARNNILAIPTSITKRTTESRTRLFYVTKILQSLWIRSILTGLGRWNNDILELDKALKVIWYIIIWLRKILGSKWERWLPQSSEKITKATTSPHRCPNSQCRHLLITLQHLVQFIKRILNSKTFLDAFSVRYCK